MLHIQRFDFLVFNIFLSNKTRFSIILNLVSDGQKQVLSKIVRYTSESGYQKNILFESENLTPFWNLTTTDFLIFVNELIRWLYKTESVYKI